MRHPQYAAFVLIMFGFLLQWPTIPTLVMFPILLVVFFISGVAGLVYEIVWSKYLALFLGATSYA